MRQRYEEQEGYGRRRHNGDDRHGMGPWQKEYEERYGERRGPSEGRRRGDEQRDRGGRDWDSGERYAQGERAGWEEEESYGQPRGGYRLQRGEGGRGGEEYGSDGYGEGGYAEQGFERQRGEGGGYGRRQGSQSGGGERLGYGSSRRGGYRPTGRWQQGYGSPHHGLGSSGQYGGEYGSRSGMRGGYRGAEDSESGYGREPWRRSEQGSDRHGGHSFRGRGPQNYKRSDERIREEICDCLTDDDAIDATNIEVRVSGGEVILVGTVDDRDSKRAAEDIAESISGVQNVQNQLRVARQDDQQRGQTGASQSYAAETSSGRPVSGSSNRTTTNGSDSDKNRKT